MSSRPGSRPTRPPPSRCRDAAPGRAEPRARPALPRRREHPGRDRPARRARRARRRARDRPGPRRPHALPRRARRARARRRARPLARAAPACGARALRQRRPRLRRRAAPRARRARATADEVGGEPPVQRRHAARRREPRRTAERRAVVRDGAARGGRPVLRHAGDEGVRGGLGARPARARADRLPSRLAHRVPSAAQRRLGARRVPTARRAARPLRRDQAPRRGRLRAPAEDASELARADRPRRPAACRAGARRPRPAADDARRAPRSRAVRGPRRAARVRRAPAPAKLNLALVVGPRRRDGTHELCTVYQRIDLCDRVSVEPAPRLEVRGFPEDTLVRAALERIAEAAGVEPRWSARIGKRIPVAAGLGGGSSDAATALRLANETLEKPLPAAELHGLAAELGADVPFFLQSGPQLGEDDGSTLSPLDLPQDYWIVVLVPRGAAKESTASVYERFDARDGAAGWEARRDELRARLAEVQR